MDRMQFVLDRLPDFYNRESQDSKIRAMVKAFTDEYDLYDGQMNAVDAMIGIDTTLGIDLDRRWGKLLNIPRAAGEYDDIYRNRMKTSISDMSGGTKYALTYAVAVILGINNNVSEMDRRIKVMDAWLYDGIETINRDKGYSVCVIDLDSASFDYKDSIDDVIQARLDDTKASGTYVQLIFHNYRIMAYLQMDLSTYIQLSSFRYNQFGNTN